MQKLLTVFSKNISLYAIFNDQSFKDTLSNNIVSFKHDEYFVYFSMKKCNVLLI